MKNKSEINPYASHPGADGKGCRHRTTVSGTDAYGRLIRAGFGCLRTGGHCLPAGCAFKKGKRSGNS